MRLTKQAGVSLVEVLTAVLVLTLGVLGAAGLQLQSLRSAHEAGLRSAAVRIAGDLAEHMRAFQPWLQRSSTADPFLGFGTEGAAAGVSSDDCQLAPCTPAQLAAHALDEAARRVRSDLPEGRILVCRDASPWDEERQAFSWDCDDGAGQGAPVVIKLGWRPRQEDPLPEVPPSIALIAHP